jgi:hypothetical protein
MDPRFAANPTGREPEHSDVDPTVYLNTLAQYPSVHEVVNAGKLGTSNNGLPSEHEASTGAISLELKVMEQLSQVVWALRAAVNAKMAQSKSSRSNLMKVKFGIRKTVARECIIKYT